MSDSASPPSLLDIRSNKSRKSVSSLVGDGIQNTASNPALETTSAATTLHDNRITMESPLEPSHRSPKHSAKDVTKANYIGLQPGPPSETFSWQSLPLIFAILPAIAGLVFQNGSAFVTDILLLGLVAIFLNWTVQIPWEWYHSSRAVTITESFAPAETTSAIRDSANDKSHKNTLEADPEEKNGSISGHKQDTNKDSSQDRYKLTPNQKAAVFTLQAYEVSALISCFLGPLIGAYVLHAIRSQLSRPSEGLVSNYNLTIFILAAELRPFSHLIKIIKERTLFLQRIVHENPYAKGPEENDGINQLSKRVEGIEAQLAALISKDSLGRAEKLPGGANTSMVLRQNLQPQLDALNRAVRRYEKRATTQTLQTEARLQDLEARIKDALALAAIAAHSTQKPGLLHFTLHWLSMLFKLPLQALYNTIMYPLHAFSRAWTFICSYTLRSKGKRQKKATSRSSLSGGAQRERSQIRLPSRG